MALDFKKVQKPARKLRKLVKKIRADALPELVHDFRTRSRQLEAILEAFGLEDARVGRRVLKPLSQLRRRAGKVRDMDVLTAFAAGIRPKDGEQDCAVQLLEHLGAQRRKQAKRLSSASRQNGSKLRRRLKQAERELARREVRSNKDSRPQAEPPVSVADLGSELASILRLDRTNLHPFRLKVKELRNMVKLAAAPDKDFLERLGTVKDAIGEWHDWEELITIAQKALDHGENCKLIQELKTIARKRYETALAEVEQLRLRYLGVSEKERRGRSRTATLPAPVLRAAMNVAA